MIARPGHGFCFFFLSFAVVVYFEMISRTSSGVFYISFASRLFYDWCMDIGNCAVVADVVIVSCIAVDQVLGKFEQIFGYNTTAMLLLSRIVNG